MKGGTLELKFAGDVNQSYANICNVSTSYYGVAPEVCKSWISLALTAKSTGKHLKLWNVTSETCFTGGALLMDKVSVAENSK
jgi:hypothetical protein